MTEPTIESLISIIAERDGQIAKLREALGRIANGHGCGCRPICQCFQEGSLKIWREEVVSIAREALAATPGDTKP